MAGHSHWAGIKHKKGRADKERSKVFSKLSREITVAAKPDIVVEFELGLFLCKKLSPLNLSELATS